MSGMSSVIIYDGPSPFYFWDQTGNDLFEFFTFSWTVNSFGAQFLCHHIPGLTPRQRLICEVRLKYTVLYNLFRKILQVKYPSK